MDIWRVITGMWVQHGPRMSKNLRQASHFRNHVAACSQGSASLREPRHSFCMALGGYLRSEHHSEILFSSFELFMAFFQHDSVWVRRVVRCGQTLQTDRCRCDTAWSLPKGFDQFLAQQLWPQCPAISTDGRAWRIWCKLMQNSVKSFFNWTFILASPLPSHQCEKSSRHCSRNAEKCASFRGVATRLK